MKLGKFSLLLLVLTLVVLQISAEESDDENGFQSDYQAQQFDDDTVKNGWYSFNLTIPIVYLTNFPLKWR